MQEAAFCGVKGNLLQHVRSSFAIQEAEYYTAKGRKRSSFFTDVAVWTQVSGLT